MLGGALSTELRGGGKRASGGASGRGGPPTLGGGGGIPVRRKKTDVFSWDGLATFVLATPYSLTVYMN